MTTFTVTERFKIPTKVYSRGCRRIDKEKIDDLWMECAKYADKRGCYIFSLKAAKGEKPFYVGKAAKQSFRHECFTIHKRAEHYDEILASRKGAPYICFVVQERKRGKWSLSAIDEIEEYLIAQAAVRNPEITNRRRLPDESWTIKGVTSGKPSAQTKSFKRLLGI